ncbi:MAG TPA: MFS transporter [Burkholderiaceae bacterium]|jgi:MFS family permease
MTDGTILTERPLHNGVGANSIATVQGPSPTLGRGAVIATVAGNALEFYDFLTYSAFSVYIGKAFFPAKTPLMSLLLSLATFGVGFCTRPLGGLLIGAYADRAGRRPALMLTISLITIGTMGLALTPPYAAIGVAAPVILVVSRLLQGLALGGEVGPSTAVLLECAPPGRRGALVSWQGASQGMAIFASGVAGVGVSALLSKEQLADWGWRLPFALGLAIVPLGIYLRSKLPETLEAPGTRSGPDVLRLLWREYRRPLTLGMMIIMCLTISTYISNYMTTYALTTLGMTASESMLATLAQGVCMIFAALGGGALSDRYGRKIVMMVPRALVIVAIYPAFLLLVALRTPWALVAVTSGLALLTSFSIAASLAALAEVFPNHVRSSGLAISYALSVSVFGGTTQFVIAWLIGTTGNPLSPAYYVIASSVVGLWAMAKLPEKRK